MPTLSSKLTLPTLDFSFTELTSMEDLLKVRARMGRAQGGGAREIEDALPVANHEEDHDDDHDGDGKKKGEGEDHPKKKTEDVVIQYQASILKLCNNGLSLLEPFAPILKSVIVNATQMLTSIDLSFNMITQIPDDIAEFPLVSIYLHANHITKVSEVMKLQQIKTLYSVTFHGNPIENSTKNYKYHMLWLMPQLKSLDFASFTKRDRETVKTYVSFYKPGEAPAKKTGGR